MAIVTSCLVVNISGTDSHVARVVECEPMAADNTERFGENTKGELVLAVLVLVQSLAPRGAGLGLLAFHC